MHAYPLIEHKVLASELPSIWKLLQVPLYATCMHAVWSMSRTVNPLCERNIVRNHNEEAAAMRADMFAPRSCCTLLKWGPLLRRYADARSQRTPPVQYMSTLLSASDARFWSTQVGQSEKQRVGGLRVSAPSCKQPIALLPQRWKTALA
jgi:hypothetical protein